MDTNEKGTGYSCSDFSPSREILEQEEAFRKSNTVKEESSESEEPTE